MKKFTKAIVALMLMMAFVCVAGCNKDSNDNNDNGSEETAIPVVETSSIREITDTNAIGGGKITSNGGSSVTECGVCWSAETNPTVNDSHAVSSSNTGTFSCQITNLVPNTTYYVRAYATNSEGVGYGNQVSFITLSGNGEVSASIPEVETSFVYEITETNAIGGGTIISDGGSSVTECGVCWSAETNPTVNDSHAVSHNSIGTFLCQITNLVPNTTYYVRAYAMNSEGISYGNQVSFITLSGNGGGPTSIPVVETSPVREITETSAIGGGVVTADGGGNIVERGVCWSTQTNPIVSGDHAIAGTGAGTFSCEIVDLVPNTTYFVRAYAINSMGVGYGNEVNFTTLSGNGGGVNAPEGAIGGVYSVSAMEKVYFSQGNLQYQASTNTWRFAEKQFYTIGEGNHYISEYYTGWIDLFGWGTSGYNHGANCYQPWSTSGSSGDYYAYGNYQYNLYDQTGQADWGYNAITNGGNQVGMWRTLTRAEWEFLLTTRYTSSGIRYAKAQVNGVNGVILVPDDWNVTTFSLNNTNESNASFTSNVVGEMVWQDVFEPTGAVFLPAAGCREGSVVDHVNSLGRYWCSTTWNYLYFYWDRFYFTSSDSYYGHSVRLVCPVE